MRFTVYGLGFTVKGLGFRAGLHARRGDELGRGGMARYEADKAKYEASDVAVHLDADLYEKIGFLPLNGGESFGRLRVMGNETRSSPRDIVICKTLPNQMPRVAGVISAERQTPLSHVNLRCVQDRVPNAFVASEQTASTSNLSGAISGGEISFALNIYVVVALVFFSL